MDDALVVRCVERPTHLQDDPAQARPRLATLAREQGREVVRTLEKAVALGDPKTDRWMPQAYRALGYALKDAGATRKAIAAFKKVLAIAPDGTDADDAERQLAILESR